MLLQARSLLAIKIVKLLSLALPCAALLLVSWAQAQSQSSGPVPGNLANFSTPPSGSPGSSAPSAQTVGIVSFVIGRANVQRAGELIALSAGSELKVGDQLLTPLNGHVHVRFVDGALVSLRPSSSLKIYEYRFDAQNPAASSVKFELEQGVVRAISGQAAEAAKDKFRLNTPLAAIGVKGTDFVVEANKSRVNAIVNQGAIVLAPFDAQCRMDALGPCSTRFSRELNAATKGMALTYSMSMPSPQLLPTGQLKGSELLNLVTPLGSVGSNPVAAVPQENTNNHVQQNRVDAKAYAGLGNILVNASTQDSLAWGRWGAQNVQDHLTIPFINALQGKSVTVGDGYYFLFRNESNVPNLLSIQQGSANFSLLNSNAYFLDAGNNVSGATVNSGQLGINFSNQTFSTNLSLSSAATPVAPQTLQASGKINLNSGIFLSAPVSGAASSTAPSVAGAVSLDTKQAGYIFTLPSGIGQFRGATLWGR
jgi:hypothetical protein